MLAMSNDSSIISSRLDEALLQLNSFTIELFTTNFSQSIALLNQVLDSQTSQKLQNLQEAFQDLYELTSTSSNISGKTNHKLISKSKDTKVDRIIEKISLDQLEKILAKATAECTFKSDDANVSAESENTVKYIVNSLEKLISAYLILILYHHLTNNLINSTILANEQLIYWDRINNSNINKWVYTLQQSPIMIFQFSKSVFTDFKEAVLKLLIHDENAVYEEYQNNSITENDDHWSRNTEEDNQFYFSQVKARYLCRLLWRSLVTTVDSLTNSIKSPAFMLYKLNMSIQTRAESGRTKLFSTLSTYQKVIFGAPIEAVNFDIFEKRQSIFNCIDKSAHGLGLLIHKLPTTGFLTILDQFMNGNDQNQLYDIISVFEGIANIEIQRDYSINERLKNITIELKNYPEPPTNSKIPSFWVRYWPLILPLVIYGPSTSFNAYANRQEIYDWLKVNIYDTVTGFYSNWIVKPISDMLNVIRHDDSTGAELSITTKESLQSDLDSLERMVIDYAVDYDKINNNSAAAFKDEIRKAVKEGNLTILMEQYEKDLKHPYSALIKGSLPRALLIQLQKTKVDGGIAINGIDKLLKSQQLVFGMVSISPSLVILYMAWNFIKNNISDRPIFVDGKDLKFVCLKSLNNIERLLSTFAEVDTEQQIYTEGYLLIETINLKRRSILLLPKSVHEMWLKDLNDLNDREWSIEGRLRAVSRIWSVYGSYFK